MDDLEYALQLKRQGYVQVSRQHRHLARLPLGKTGKQALFEAAFKKYAALSNAESVEFWRQATERWVENIGEASATDHFCRVYAHEYPGCSKTVSITVFKEFRRLGGSTAVK